MKSCADTSTIRDLSAFSLWSIADVEIELECESSYSSQSWLLLVTLTQVTKYSNHCYPNRDCFVPIKFVVVTSIWQNLGKAGTIWFSSDWTLLLTSSGTICYSSFIVLANQPLHPTAWKTYEKMRCQKKDNPTFPLLLPTKIQHKGEIIYKIHVLTLLALFHIAFLCKDETLVFTPHYD